ncbi:MULTISPECIES: hypothetical protein [Rheinheimera]|uniref:Uncharacterized protein n=1 Tax=Rheinheimera marina TaxID=1774958 RepID=A0ABV9JI22_9GAMM
MSDYDIIYMQEVNELLLATYSISVLDTGLSCAEWQLRFGDRPANEAVEFYAEEYGLTELE